MTKDKNNVVVDWPMGCNKPGCQGGFDVDNPDNKIPYVMRAKSDPLIIFMRVKHKNGVVSVDRPRRFMIPGKKQLKPGIMFLAWIARCSECFIADQKGE